MSGRGGAKRRQEEEERKRNQKRGGRKGERRRRRRSIGVSNLGGRRAHIISKVIKSFTGNVFRCLFVFRGVRLERRVETVRPSTKRRREEGDRTMKRRSDAQDHKEKKKRGGRDAVKRRKRAGEWGASPPHPPFFSFFWEGKTGLGRKERKARKGERVKSRAIKKGKEKETMAKGRKAREQRRREGDKEEDEANPDATQFRYLSIYLSIYPVWGP